MMHKRYTKEQLKAVEAQRLAQEIAFGPVVFQVSRLMLKFGIFQLLADKRKGYTLQEISVQTGLTRYAAQVLSRTFLSGRGSFKWSAGRIESIRRMAYHLRRTFPTAGTGTEKLVWL